MRKDIEKLLTEILLLGIKVNVKTKHSIFVAYSGHVNSYEFSMIRNGYPKNNGDFKLEYLGKTYLDKDSRIVKEDLKYIKNKLTKLLEGR